MYYHSAYRGYVCASLACCCCSDERTRGRITARHVNMGPFGSIKREGDSRAHKLLRNASSLSYRIEPENRAPRLATPVSDDNAAAAVFICALLPVVSLASNAYPRLWTSNAIQKEGRKEACAGGAGLAPAAIAGFIANHACSTLLDVDVLNARSTSMARLVVDAIISHMSCARRRGRRHAHSWRARARIAARTNIRTMPAKETVAPLMALISLLWPPSTMPLMGCLSNLLCHSPLMYLQHACIYG